MFEVLYQLPDIKVLMFVSGFFILLAILSVCLIRLFVPLDLRYKDNAVIGTISSLISIIYGVLVGLSALYLINNLSYTSDAVQREANSAANTYRSSEWLTEPTRTNIQNTIKLYLHQVVDVEWPEMQARKKVDKKGIALIGKINEQLIHYPAKTTSDTLILPGLVQNIQNLYDAREQRLHMSNFELNAEMWIVILIGAVLTIAVNFLFGMNFYLHVLSISAVALMASSMVFLLLTLERPFEGEFVIEPTALKAVLDIIENHTIRF